MLRKSYWTLRYFECPNCGIIVTAPKTDGRSHSGHIKTMYCYVCKKETNHVQVDVERAR